MAETTETGEVAQVAPEAPSTIADHMKQFGLPQQRDAAAVVAPETPEAAPAEPEPEPDPHPSAQQRRDRQTGQFADGKVRVKSKDAATRIDALTARAKTAEERAAALETEVSRLKAQGAAPQTVARAEAVADAAHAKTDDPEPRETDPAFGGDTLKFLDARARWNARQEFQTLRQKDAEAFTAAERARREQDTLKTWAGRVQAARDKYDDFDQVALGRAVPWLDQRGKPLPNGAAIDAWIMEDETGPDVLHFLQSHPDETDALMGMPPIQQLKRLALITQRFASTPNGSPGTTGSGAARTIVLPPKPPNPVRTEAQRGAMNAPPPTDGSLSLAEHAKAFGRR